MPRRSIWSALQRAALFDLPADEATLLRHHTLSDDDIEHIRVRRGGHNRLAFALQLFAFGFTPWVGPHPAHRRIPVAKAPIVDLAYDPALYRSRSE